MKGQEESHVGPRCESQAGWRLEEAKGSSTSCLCNPAFVCEPVFSALREIFLLDGSAECGWKENQEACSQILVLILSACKHLLSTYYMPGMILSARDIAGSKNRQKKIPVLMELTFL